LWTDCFSRLPAYFDCHEREIARLAGQYLPIRNEIRRAIDQVCDEQALILGPAVERLREEPGELLPDEATRSA
jgi:hypothetical protein